MMVVATASVVVMGVGIADGIVASLMLAVVEVGLDILSLALDGFDAGSGLHGLG